LISYGLLFQLSDIIAGLHWKRRKVEQRDDLIIGYLQQTSRILNIATVPLHLGGWRILYDTEHNWVSPFNSIQGKSEVFKTYSMLDPNKLDDAARIFNLDMIFINAETLKATFSITEPLDVEGFRKKMLDDHIMVLEKK